MEEKQFVSQLKKEIESKEAELNKIFIEFTSYFDSYKEIVKDLLQSKKSYINILEKYNLDHEFNYIPNSQFSNNIILNKKINKGVDDSKELLNLQDTIEELSSDNDLLKSKIINLAKALNREVNSYVKNANDLNEYYDNIVSNEEVYGIPNDFTIKQNESIFKLKKKLKEIAAEFDIDPRYKNDYSKQNIVLYDVNDKKIGEVPIQDFLDSVSAGKPVKQAAKFPAHTMKFMRAINMLIKNNRTDVTKKFDIGNSYDISLKKGINGKLIPTISADKEKK